MEMNLRVCVCWILMFVGGALCLSAQGGSLSTALEGLSLEAAVDVGYNNSSSESCGKKEAKGAHGKHAGERRRASGKGEAEEAVTVDVPVVPAGAELSMTSDHFWPCFEFYWGMQAWTNLWLNYGNGFVHSSRGYAPFAEEMYWTFGHVIASLGKLPNTGLVYHLNRYLVGMRRHLWRLAGKMPESTYRGYYNSSETVDCAVDALFHALKQCLHGDALRRLEAIGQAVDSYRGSLGNAMRADTSLYGSLVFACLFKELAVLVLDLIPEWQEVMFSVFLEGEHVTQKEITRLRNQIAVPRYAGAFRRNLFNYIYHQLLLIEMQPPLGLGEERSARMNEVLPWMRLAVEALGYPADQGREYWVGLPQQQEALTFSFDDDSEVSSDDDDSDVSYLDDDDDGEEDEEEADDNGQDTLTTQQNNNQTTHTLVNVRNAFYGVPVWLDVRLYDGRGCQQ